LQPQNQITVERSIGTVDDRGSGICLVMPIMNRAERICRSSRNGPSGSVSPGGLFSHHDRSRIDLAATASSRATVPIRAKNKLRCAKLGPGGNG
jgi:hypothetical protein